MENTELLLRFLRYSAALPALCWDGTERMLEEIAQKHCFFEQAQPLLTVPGLSSVLNHMQPATGYEIEDILGIHLFALTFQGHAILVGPFVTDQWNDIKAEENLTRAKLSAEYLPVYKLYYCSYALLDWHLVVQNITGAIIALLPDAPAYRFCKVSGAEREIRFNLEPLEAPDFDSAVRRYEGENKFLALVEEGRTEEAVEVVSKIGNVPLVKELSGPGLHVLIANATTMRTLVRKAAERGGVHPAIVDAIALSYAQKMYTVRKAEELKAIVSDMTREFTNAVRTAQDGRYSPIIRRAISYLRLHISQKMDVKSLADAAGCTPNYLGRRFKEETGLTLARFLAQERCRRAAVLLVETGVPVQEISAHVGYLDNNYFVKIFKSCMGDTPTAYRNRFRR